jgi:hypothetical protein
VALVVGLSAAPVAAQTAIPPLKPAAIVGTVTSDPSHAAIPGVEVTLQEPRRSVTTDASGAFTFPDVAPGSYRITARKIGFGPLDATVKLEVGGRLDADLELTPLSPQMLRGVEVRADSVLHGNMIGLAMRQANNQGTILRRDVLDSARGTPISELLNKRARGAKIVSFGRTGGSLIATGRGFGSISLIPLADPTDPKSPHACFSQVIVDGLRIYAPDATSRNSPPDLKQWDSGTLEAVEFYAGPATTPPEFGTMGTQCGTLVLWTRGSR